MSGTNQQHNSNTKIISQPNLDFSFGDIHYEEGSEIETKEIKVKVTEREEETKFDSSNSQESNQSTPFLVEFPIEKSCLYGRKMKRPDILMIKEIPYGEEYEKAKLNTWTDGKTLHHKKRAEKFSVLRNILDEAYEYLAKKKSSIEVFFSNKNALVIAGPIELVADGYFLPWLFEVRLSKANLLKVIELCNLEIDQESGNALIKAINNNSSLLEELKIYKCTFPIGMFSSLKGKDLKNLQSFQLFCPQLEFEEVLELIKKLPQTLSQLSIGEFEFNGSMEAGHEFIEQLMRPERLKTLHLYYDGNPLLQIMFRYEIPILHNKQNSKISRKMYQIIDLKIYNQNSKHESTKCQKEIDTEPQEYSIISPKKKKEKFSTKPLLLTNTTKGFEGDKRVDVMNSLVVNNFPIFKLKKEINPQLLKDISFSNEESRKN